MTEDNDLFLQEKVLANYQIAYCIVLPHWPDRNGSYQPCSQTSEQTCTSPNALVIDIAWMQFGVCWAVLA